MKGHSHMQETNGYCEGRVSDKNHYWKSMAQYDKMVTFEVGFKNLSFRMHAYIYTLSQVGAEFVT